MVSCSCIPPPASLRPRKTYNLLVPDVFSSSTVPDISEPISSSTQRKIGKLQEYVNTNPSKAGKVSRRLNRRIKKALYDKHLGWVKVAVQAYCVLLDQSTAPGSNYTFSYFNQELIHQPDALISTLLSYQQRPEVQALAAQLLTSYLNAQTELEHQAQADADLVQRVLKLLRPEPNTAQDIKPAAVLPARQQLQSWSLAVVQAYVQLCHRLKILPQLLELIEVTLLNSVEQDVYAGLPLRPTLSSSEAPSPASTSHSGVGITGIQKDRDSGGKGVPAAVAAASSTADAPPLLQAASILLNFRPFLQDSSSVRRVVGVLLQWLDDKGRWGREDLVQNLVGLVRHACGGLTYPLISCFLRHCAAQPQLTPQQRAIVARLAVQQASEYSLSAFNLALLELPRAMLAASGQDGAQYLHAAAAEVCVALAKEVSDCGQVGEALATVLRSQLLGGNGNSNSTGAVNAMFGGTATTTGDGPSAAHASATLVQSAGTTPPSPFMTPTVSTHTATAAGTSVSIGMVTISTTSTAAAGGAVVHTTSAATGLAATNAGGAVQHAAQLSTSTAASTMALPQQQLLLRQYTLECGLAVARALPELGMQVPQFTSRMLPPTLLPSLASVLTPPLASPAHALLIHLSLRLLAALLCCVHGPLKDEKQALQLLAFAPGVLDALSPPASTTQVITGGSTFASNHSNSTMGNVAPHSEIQPEDVQAVGEVVAAALTCGRPVVLLQAVRVAIRWSYQADAAAAAAKTATGVGAAGRWRVRAWVCALLAHTCMQQLAPSLMCDQLQQIQVHLANVPALQQAAGHRLVAQATAWGSDVPLPPDLHDWRNGCVHALQQEGVLATDAQIAPQLAELLVGAPTAAPLPTKHPEQPAAATVAAARTAAAIPPVLADGVPESNASLSRPQGSSGPSWVAAMRQGSIRRDQLNVARVMDMLGFDEAHNHHASDSQQAARADGIATSMRSPTAMQPVEHQQQQQSGTHAVASPAPMDVQQLLAATAQMSDAFARQDVLATQGAVHASQRTAVASIQELLEQLEPLALMT